MTGQGTGAGMRGEAPDTAIVVRHCRGLGEFERCVEVQRRVWAGDDIEVVPLPVFVVAAETGGQVLGAFAGEKMIGFTLAVAGVHGSKPFLHSHMTAVLGEYRDRGIGRRLKLFQRQDALERGIGLVEWTFDPLELRNAYFNLVRLGAIVRQLLPNCYGITTSPLHAGLPTDRLKAEWWLRSARVERVLSGAAPGGPAGSHVERIRVPAAISEMKQNDLAQAGRVQREIREQFEQWFARGYAATGLEIAAADGNYLLEPWSES